MLINTKLRFLCNYSRPVLSIKIHSIKSCLFRTNNTTKFNQWTLRVGHPPGNSQSTYFVIKITKFLPFNKTSNYCKNVRTFLQVFSEKLLLKFVIVKIMDPTGLICILHHLFAMENGPNVLQCKNVKKLRYEIIWIKSLS